MIPIIRFGLRKGKDEYPYYGPNMILAIIQASTVCRHIRLQRTLTGMCTRLRVQGLGVSQNGNS